MAECFNSQSKLFNFLEIGLENRRGRAETSVDSLPQAQESCLEAILCAAGVPLNQMSEGKFNLHLTMHSLIVANIVKRKIVKRKINSSVQCGCKQCSLHKHNYLSLI